ncbi:MAG: flippase-like domain-containing protein [Planctomycetes bacterium]|nr:flippase-like domain-containing protein [Planctomycetota bacterium]
MNQNVALGEVPADARAQGSAGSASTLTRRLARAGLYVLGLALVLGLILHSRITTAEALAILYRANPWHIAYAAVAAVAMLVCSACKWEVLVRASTSVRPLPRLFFFHTAAAAHVVAQIAPQGVGSTATKGLALSVRDGFSLQRGLYIALFDHFGDLIVMLLFAVAGLAFFSGKASACVALGIAGLICLAVFAAALRWHVAMPRLLIGTWNSLAGLAARLLHRKIRPLPVEEGRLGRREVMAIFGLSLAKYVAMNLRVHAVVLMLGLPLGLPELLLYTAFIQIVSILGCTPGGLGFVEAGWYGALFLIGVEEPEAVVFLGVLRISSIAGDFLMFLVLHWAWRLHGRTGHPGGP